MSQTLKPVLTAALAKRIAEACAARARQEGWNMIIAIADTSGTLKHYTRMDDSIGISVKLSQLKAATSASLPVSTRRFREIAKNNALGLELTPGTTTVAGGLPIVTADGVHLGGVGVSGGSEDQDEVCAQAGLDAVEDLLK
ncbi:MAG: heme-binding protein [Burkholderiales bacterium]|jgi:glc operon protein GlcG|nr:heme-binding protein [Burkholderiales bacterium]